MHRTPDASPALSRAAFACLFVVASLLLVVGCSGDDRSRLGSTEDTDVSSIGGDASDVDFDIGLNDVFPTDVDDDDLGDTGDGDAADAPDVDDTSDGGGGPACGNGAHERSNREQCDGDDLAGTICKDFGYAGGDLGCADDCTFDFAACELPESCGDGSVDGEEECDDGNNDAGDGCGPACREEFCGDEIVQAGLGEACEPGVISSLSCDELGFEAGEVACNDLCEADTSRCRMIECGDGFVDGDEACDDGEDNSDTDPDACRSDCTLPACGDGVEDDGEACDDGNLENNDGCTAACTIEGCGDGRLQLSLGEQCDDGEDNSDTEPNACRTDCTLAGCGDGVEDEGEACDMGDENADDVPDVCRTDCTLPACGDGVADEGEACDFGEANADDIPDACRTDCSLPSCGDDVIDEGEACDDGEDNSDTEPDACRSDCSLPVCGDGVVDADETCDDGDENSDSEPDACRTDCTHATCGDGIVDDGEACDDGEDNSDTEPGACRTDCSLPTCGDGVLDEGEACDDGEANSDTEADACRTDCALPTCGDGVADAGEACDEGAENSDTEPGACRTDCSAAACGDGVLDPDEECDDGNRRTELCGYGDESCTVCAADCVNRLVTGTFCGDGIRQADHEECDDGDDDDTDACLTTCREARCGDGAVRAGVEACDDGVDNSDTSPDACRTDCSLPTCGDGATDTGEECDDGVDNSDTEPGACRTDCAAPTCGDEIVDPGEDCDDGNEITESCEYGERTCVVCAADCVEFGLRGVYCGDGTLQLGFEECDDGDSDDSDDCPTTCQEAECGDGFVHAEDEECDDGEDNSDIAPGACRTDCSLPTCGDGTVDDGEACDDGNRNDNDACLNDCTEAFCGDGVVHVGVEECDDGDDNSDTTSGACRTDCTSPTCGDGVADPDEECDDGNRDDNDACLNDCTEAFCGDGVVRTGVEECDDGDENSDTTPGACRESCTLPFCGDDVTDPGEECDDGADNSNTAPDACRRDCSDPSCGDAVVDSGEECDDGNAVDNDGCANSCVPVLDDLCTPCTANAQCGRDQDVCLFLTDGRRCGVACDSNADCPSGFGCNEVFVGGEPTSQCVPSGGVCEGCVDADGDDYGIGPECLGFDCNDDAGEINPSSDEICDNDIDDDCDGLLDCDDAECEALPTCATGDCVDFDIGSTIGEEALIIEMSGDETDDNLPECGSGVARPDAATVWSAPTAGRFVIDTFGSAAGTVLDVRRESCTGEVVGCNDNAMSGVFTSRVELDATAGQRFVIFTEFFFGGSGEIVLNIRKTERGQCADGSDNDGDGDIDCDDAECASDPVCLAELCPTDDAGSLVGEGVAAGTTTGELNLFAPSCDSSSDAPESTISWTAPFDGPYRFSTAGSDFDVALSVLRGGCAGEEIVCDAQLSFGDDEATVTATFEAGEDAVIVVDGVDDETGDFNLDIELLETGACEDGEDNDFDGSTDCDDPDCSADTACVDIVCPSVVELGEMVGTNVATGAFPSGASALTADCSTFSSSGAEAVHRWVAPDSGEYRAVARGIGTTPSLYVRESSCMGREIACDTTFGGTPAELTFDAVERSVYYIVVDSNDDSGEYQLDVIRTEGGRCDDGEDNDGDEAIDCEDDECTSDPACIDRFCPDDNLAGRLGDEVASGTTTGERNALSPSCVTLSRAPDVSFAWTAPFAGRFTFDTRGSAFDTVLYATAPGCGGAELACDDDVDGTRQSEIVLDLDRGEGIVLHIDGWSSNSGRYELNINAAEGACDDGLDGDRDGRIDCADEECAREAACVAAACPEADLGSELGRGILIDAYGDALNNFEGSCRGATHAERAFSWTAPYTGAFTFDAGESDVVTAIYARRGSCAGPEIDCESPRSPAIGGRIEVDATEGEKIFVFLENVGLLDDRDFQLDILGSEADFCADGTDNDFDDAIDCDDIDCFSFDACFLERCPDEHLDSTIGEAVWAGTTAGGFDDADGTCGGGLAEDVALMWTAPRAGTWRFDTFGSAFDTVLYARDAACNGEELDCNDQAGDLDQSELVLDLEADQTIVLFIDGFTGATGEAVLNVAEVLDDGDE